MADMVSRLLRLVGLVTLLSGALIAFFAITASPPLYPPIETSYVLIGVLLGLAGFVTVVSKYRVD
ncbi:MAG: hypothetical protein JRN29_01890 [Nitrososphaerota archaeon]|nr:hypothetical protein [Nitrososphaerota archaeon]